MLNDGSKFLAFPRLRRMANAAPLAINMTIRGKRLCRNFWRNGRLIRFNHKTTAANSDGIRTMSNLIHPVQCQSISCVKHATMFSPAMLPIAIGGAVSPAQSERSFRAVRSARTISFNTWRPPSPKTPQCAALNTTGMLWATPNTMGLMG